MALEIAATVLDPIINYIVKPIGRQLSYLICYGSNIRDLKVKTEELKELRDDVEKSKKEANRNLERVGGAAEEWLKETDKILEKTNTVLPSEADIGKGCLSQGLKSRYVLSKRAKLMTNDVTQQKYDGKNYKGIFLRASPVKSYPTSKNDSDDGMSRQSILGEIIKALNDEEINMIAICGPGGVGKTRMEEKVIANAEEESLFNKIVFARVTLQFNLKNLQSLIAESLGLQLQEMGPDMRANKLKARLKNENKVLLVLDDVWEKLDLEEIGIPLGEEHKGCKVMLTSRNHEVCSSTLSTARKIFTIESLSVEESWQLFRRNVGNRTNDHALNQIAQDISKECGGLPLVILTVANALKDKRLDIWKGALAQLRSADPENITGMGKVYDSLKLSYEQLESHEAKKLYLHCCLFPEDHPIPLETLAMRGMSLGMFTSVNSLQEARIRVEMLVDKLKDCFLLLAGKDDNSVIMHDLLRDLAIYITSREHLFVINHDLKLKQWPRDISHEATCISVRLSNPTVMHPEMLKCPKLEFLELEIRGETSRSLLDNIFQGTRELKTIEISYMTFSLLPSSIGLLKNLRMLRLIYCKMENISLIGELINLEILSLRDSQFHVFPAELGSLEKLRLLDLNSCEALERIEPNTLSRFVELEELDMKGCCNVQWEIANEGEQSRNISLTKLGAMQNLTTLRVYISDKAIPTDTSLPSELEEYNICIAPSYKYRCFYSKYSKMIWCESDAEHGLNWIHTIVPGAENLLLRKSVGKQVLDLLARSESTFQNVKSFDIGECDELLYLANTSQYDCFSNLNTICLKDCDNMEHVYLLEEDNHGGGHKVKFPLLEEIELDSLKALKGFYNGTRNIELPSLSTLRLKRLPNIKGFFPNDDSYSTEPNKSAKENFLFRNEDTLGSLKDLTLWEFDNSMLFCNQLVSHPSFKNLESLYIWYCKNVPHCLFRDVVSDDALSVKEEEERLIRNSLFPHLKDLDLYELPDLRCVVPLNMQKVPFPNLKELKVYFCNRLLHFSSLSVAMTSLQQVESISFFDCIEMEQVFVLEEDEPRCGNQSQIRDIRFPMLKKLKLDYLPALTAFCKGINSIDFPNLRELRIDGLNNIKGFVTEDAEQSNDSRFLFGSKDAFGSLKHLTLEKFDNSMLFCNQLVSHPCFKTLESLSIRWCKNVPDCLFRDVVSDEERVIHNSLFPHLKALFLDHLPDLRCVVSLNMQKVPFPNLKNLQVQCCDRLLHFSSLWTSLQQVESIYFYDCIEMEQVFVLEEDEPRCCNQSQICDIRFPVLRKLDLSSLPALTAFCKGINSIDFPNLRELEIRGLNNIKGFVTEDAEQSNDSGFLFGSKVSFGRLEELVLQRLDSELWFHQLSSTYFRQLRSLQIWSCHKMRTYSSIGFLENLKDLSIYNCSQIEVIIGEDEEGGKHALHFPKLYQLRLEDLPKLRSFSQRKLHFPSLEKVKIIDCSEMQTFAQGYISTLKLRKLKINGIPFPVNDINNSIRQHFDEKQANTTKNEEIISVDEDVEKTSEEEVDEEVEKTCKEEVEEKVAKEKTSEEEANAEKIEVVAEEITSEEEMDEKIEIMEQVTEQITSEE